MASFSAVGDGEQTINHQKRETCNDLQAQLLFWRAWTAHVRNPADVAGRLIVTALTALIVGLVFLDIPDGESGSCLARS